jgi:hypothetical protein
MADDISSPEFQIKLLAGIGNVCLQWSLLEHNVLFVILAIEDLPQVKGEIIFGGLDLRPRLGMALNLAVEAKLPKPLQKRISKLRDTLRDEDLYNRRNRVVHGAQRTSDDPHSIVFHIVRNKGNTKDENLDPLEIGVLGNRIAELAGEAWSIFQGIGAWKFPEHGEKNGPY